MQHGKRVNYQDITSINRAWLLVWFVIMELFSLDGTSSIQYEIPKTYIQTVLDKAVSDEDWATLHLLFLGGGGPKKFEKGLGGLADGCDASKVPLTEVISCDFSDLRKFVSVLLDHKARDSPQKTI